MSSSTSAATADGVLVVYHDPRVGPTGPPLSRLTHTELSERAGYDVPVVDEVMALIAGAARGAPGPQGGGLRAGGGRPGGGPCSVRTGLS
ncbi:hypothetical protein [Streptomyces violaceus]|uniref:hypothetical protein n=1 Tax=Streptomyces violaceus TaxID=1936 RepID=UPI0031F191DF